MTKTLKDYRKQFYSLVVLIIEGSSYGEVSSSYKGEMLKQFYGEVALS